MIKNSYVFFHLFLLLVRLIEDRSEYYKINIRYASFFKCLTMSFIYDACFVLVQTQK